VLASLVGALQLVFGFIDMMRDGHRYAYGVYLVASLAPLSLLQQLMVLVAFVIVMPVARRLSGETRPLGFLETLSVGALTLILLAILWQLALIAGGGHALTQRGQVATGALVAGTFADVAGLVLGALLYPAIHRRFWRRVPPRR
jgi:membrane associated rhomboid family serine protease